MHYQSSIYPSLPMVAVLASFTAPSPRGPAMSCLDALSRLGLHPAALQPHEMRLSPRRLGLSSSFSCRFYTLVSRQLTICNTHSSADDLWVAASEITDALLPSGGTLLELVHFLLELGMDHEEIKNIVRKFPAFAYYNVDRNIKPLVELLIGLGVPRSSIPGIIKKKPQLCGISVSEKLEPMMVYLENIGVNKVQLIKVICRSPAFLTHSRNKVETTLSFLTELGVSKENFGKILSRFPSLIHYSVDDNLRPTAEYFRSIGADVASLIQQSPQAFGLNVETKLKPFTEFFLERGFSMEEIGIMVNRFGNIPTVSVEGNLLPKYEFFLTMEYPRVELVKFPQYFGFSLEQRIKPRYAQMTNYGVRLILNQMLSVSNARFEEILKRRL